MSEITEPEQLTQGCADCGEPVAVNDRGDFVHTGPRPDGVADHPARVQAPEPPARVASPAPFGIGDLAAWLGGYGVKLDEVRRLEVVTRNFLPRSIDGRELATTWLRIDKVRTDEDGRPFAVYEQGEHRLATELLLIPIHDLPAAAAEQAGMVAAREAVVDELLLRAEQARGSWVAPTGEAIAACLENLAHDLGCGCDRSPIGHIVEWAEARRPAEQETCCSLGACEPADRGEQS